MKERYVVKLGGEVMLNKPGLDALAADIAKLVSEGVGITVVHGGGPQADELSARLGYTSRKVGGRRVTDDGALEVAKMVFGGTLNIEVLAALRRHKARGVGVSGVDAGLITVTRRPPVEIRVEKEGTQEWVDFGHVGDVVSVDVALLEMFLVGGYVPVVASLAADAEGAIYNVNADTVAQTLAVGLGVSGLIMVTNVPGIMKNPSDSASLLRSATRAEIEELIALGVITGGMLPKVAGCLKSLAAGVKRVYIIDGTGEGSQLLERLRGGRVGTEIVAG